MLQNNKTFSSFSTNDIKMAKKFYGETLGLKAVEDEKMGILNVFTDGGELMIYPKPDHEPATFTVLNFVVDNIDQAVDELAKRGVQFEKYDTREIKTNEKGISKWEGGPAMAWFKDPAGNILALMQK